MSLPRLSGLRPTAPLMAPMLIAAVLIVVMGPLSAPPSGFRASDAGAWAMCVVAVALLAARGRWPISVLAVESLATAGYAAIGYSGGGPYWCALIALYRVGRAHGPRARFLGVAAVVSGLWLGALASPAPVVANSTTWGSALTVGVLFAAREMRQRELLETATEERIRAAETARAQKAARQLSEERVRISRELHDVLGHSLAVIGVQAGVGAHLIEDRPGDAKQALLVIKQTSRDALAEIRRTLHALREPEDAHDRGPAPGLDQIDRLVEGANAAGLSTAVTITGTAQPLPAAVDLAGYRVIQESLTNAIKHAAPANARLQLTHTEEALEIAVLNTMRPGPEPAVAHGGGHGLVGMRERVTSLGGTFRAGPDGSGSFEVRVCLPRRSTT